MPVFGHGVSAVNRRQVLYRPEERPGFTAWVTAFDYGNGRLGLSFKETVARPDPDYRPPTLEFGEAVGAPVSYCSVECGSAGERSFRVYMASDDGGNTYYETGRCPLEEGSFCNIGFPDGRIIGLDVPRINPEGTGWCDYITLRESRDGGTTWRSLPHLLKDTAPYLWRVRRLRDGSCLVLASFCGSPWGPGRERPTRTAALPGETYLSKFQTFFLHTRDGVHYTGPHYILPGIGAHEYDVAELADGRLLFLAGDVQATPAGRQLVRREGDRFLNGPLLPVRRGAPTDPAENPQGGFVPESVVVLPGDLLVGSRRNKPYACSADLGENWFEIEGLPTSLYQPFLQLLPDGSLANFGHFGGDSALGQEDMYIAADRFTLSGSPPAGCTLSLRRLLTEDGGSYRNAYEAALTQGGRPLAGKTVTFRVTPTWNRDGTAAVHLGDASPLLRSAVTDETGAARIALPEFDGRPDIHLYYFIDAAFHPEPGEALLPCSSQILSEAALTPRRTCRYPHDAYFAGGTLYISPRLEAAVPSVYQELSPLCGLPGRELHHPLSPALEAALLEAQVLRREEGRLMWLESVHAPEPLHAVAPMGSGDWYV